MRSVLSITAVFLATFLTISIACAEDKVQKSELTSSNKQLTDITQREKKCEIRDVKLHRSSESMKIRFWGEVIKTPKTPRNKEKTEQLGLINQ